MFDVYDTFPTKLMLPEVPFPSFFGDTGRRVSLTVLVNTQLFKASDFCKPWGLPKCQTVSQGGELHGHTMPLSHRSQRGRSQPPSVLVQACLGLSPSAGWVMGSHDRPETGRGLSSVRGLRARPQLRRALPHSALLLLLLWLGTEWRRGLHGLSQVKVESRDVWSPREIDACELTVATSLSQLACV